MRVLVNNNMVKLNEVDIPITSFGLAPKQQFLLRGIKPVYPVDDNGNKTSNEPIGFKYDVLDSHSLSTLTIRVDGPACVTPEAFQTSEGVINIEINDLRAKLYKVEYGTGYLSLNGSSAKVVASK